MNEILSNLGKRIKAIRKDRKLTQEQLSEMIGIEPPSMSYMENGKFAPSPENLLKLSKALNVKPYEFYYFDIANELEMRNFVIDSMCKNKKLLKLLYTICKEFEYS